MKESIKVSNVSKRYGDIQAVHNISFTVQQEEIFAFLGPNGAGKSTTISMLCTLLDFDEGSICIEGYTRCREDAHIRSVFGVVFQGSCLDDTLSVKQNLLLRCGLYGLYRKDAKKRIQEIMEMCSLQEIQYQRVEQLSGGQRRRVDIARALIPSPKLLILDEPSTGLDPKSRSDLWSTIAYLKQQCHMTIFMTTHYMEEAEIADHICMIHKGHIILDGRKDVLLQQYQKDHVKIYTQAKQQVIQILKQKRMSYVVEEEVLVVDVDNFYQFMSLLRGVEMYVHHIEMEKGSIEAMYLTLLKKESI